ncbi:MAG: V-type ATP synthase subunit F [Pyrobaculum sp.]
MYLIIGDRYTVALFKLMGFEGKVIEDPTEVLRFIEKNLEIYSAIFISSKVTKNIRKELDEIRIKTKKLVVELPSVEEGMEKEVNYLQIVRQVLGG